MEKGFFHPQVGYWQTIAEPNSSALAEYPAGTIEVPLKPGENFDWDGIAWVAVPEPAPTKAVQEAIRQAAYASESDPLFFMSQRGEATVEEWQAKVAEIKARYPYPEETQA
jgi:hypothetical protein